jgi:hypothetical protein
MRALNLLRTAPHYRRDAFDSGLKASGFKLVERLDRPEPGDVLVIWNRYAGYAEVADNFERRGAAVLVAENCPFGNSWRGGVWYSLARRHVALTGGEIHDGGPSRWDSWGVELAPFRDGKETVVLAQRGLGHNDIKSPDGWAEAVQRKIGGRIRQHPGTGPAKPLADDLRKAREVVTWSSAAAVQALTLGVPVWHAHPKFVCAAASRPLSEFPGDPRRDDAARLACLRRLAWAIWSLAEIESGEAIEHILAA